MTVGTTRRVLKKRSASLAFISDEATSSWIDLASFAASRSFVGVVIRSTSTTSMPSAVHPAERRLDERGLAVAAGRDQGDVLAVPEVARELVELGLAVGERLVGDEVAVGERVPRMLHASSYYTKWCYT